MNGSGYIMLFMTVALCVADVTLAGAEESGSPVAALHQEYRDAVAAQWGSVTEFDMRYQEELKKLQDTVAKEGNLEQVLTVKAEIEGYSKDMERNYRDFPRLGQLRKIYEENTAKLRAEAAEGQKKIAEQYAEKLDDLKADLTRAGKLEEALKADELQKSILKTTAEASGTPRGGGAEKLRVLWTLRTERDFTPMRQCRAERAGGNWVITGLPGRQLLDDFSSILSDEKFEPPFRISSRVATDSHEIRYYLDDRHLALFAWHNGPTNLNVHDPLGGDRKLALPGKGALEKNRFYDIDIDVTTGGVAIYCDGELRAELPGDYSALEAAAGIGQAAGSRVTIEKFEVLELPAAAGAGGPSP